MLNNPIRFNDPTGHMCREDGKGCDGSMGGGVKIGDKIIRESEKVGGSKGNSGHSGGGGGGDNPCGSKPPYNPKYVCGITITEPSYITAIEPRVVEMVVDDDYTEFSWMGRNPSLNGQSITPIVTRKGQAVGWAQVIMDGMIYAHYNTDMLGRVTGSYVTGLIPSITSIKTGASLVGGIGVYNQTGSEVIVNNVIINNQNQSFNAPTIPNGSIGIIDAPVLRVSGDILVEVRYSVFNWNKNGDASIYAAGTISYNGHIGP